MLNDFQVFDYEDIQLIPAKCVVKSRAEADTRMKFGNHTFSLPVVQSNMQKIIDESVAEELLPNSQVVQGKMVLSYLCNHEEYPVEEPQRYLLVERIGYQLRRWKLER